jgi:sporulation protein YlmC with PRC-barrel domain
MRRSAALMAMLAVLTQARADGGFYEHLLEPASVPLADIIGMRVRASDGRALGRIVDLVSDRDTGEIEQVVLEHSSHPVGALIASETPGELVLEQALPGLASAGTTSLRARAKAPLFAASRDGAERSRLVVDLMDGRLKSAR